MDALNSTESKIIHPAAVPAKTLKSAEDAMSELATRRWWFSTRLGIIENFAGRGFLRQIFSLVSSLLFMYEIE